MKRITLAIGSISLALATGLGTLYAQVPAQNGNNAAALPPNPNQLPGAGAAVDQQANANVPRGPRTARYPQSVPVQRPGYSLYGGPSQSEYPERHGVTGPIFSPIYKIPGVPDDIMAADKAREARRNAAVEFGMFRRQFTGSTEFWMDHDRTQLARARYSMDEPMWHSIHPDYEWGDGGYMYNTGAFVGGPQWSGSTQRVIVHPPLPTARIPFLSSPKSVPTLSVRT